MKKTVVVYTSKYGSTEKYAKWIAEALQADLFASSGVSVEQLQNYETIVYGGGIYAGGIKGVSLIRKNDAALAGKRIFVFAVGASQPDEEAIHEIRKRNLQGGLEQVPFYYFRGGFDVERMKLPDRLMVRMLLRMLRKKDASALSGWERDMLDNAGQAVDFTSPELIGPLVQAVEHDN